MRDNTKLLFSSAVSGGNFELYVKSISEDFGCHARIYLTPLRHRFQLPCPDGQGEQISEKVLNQALNVSKFYFSSNLLCNYIYLQDEKAIVLFDDEETISQKRARAAQYGIHIV